MIKTECPECSGRIIENVGEYVCSSCGLVVDQVYEPLRSDYPYEGEKSKTALGNRLHIVDGLGSYIDYLNANCFYDTKGSPLSARKQNFYRRLKYRYNLYGRVKDQQTDYRIFRILNRISSKLNLSNHIRDSAAYHYRKIKKRFRGRIKNHVVLIALCLILAIRNNKELIQVNLRELCEVFRKLGHRVTPRSITRLAFQLKIKLGYTIKNVKSEEYITKIISALSNSVEIKNKLNTNKENQNNYWQLLNLETFKLLRNISKMDRGGRNPYVFAAAAVYAAEQKIARENNRRPYLTQREIAEITHVAEYSIRDHFCSILKKYIH
ncbi:MAG: hypothetical protein ACTSYR_01195 [Candidatus Odinarchaeia archaeon]